MLPFVKFFLLIKKIKSHIKNDHLTSAQVSDLLGPSKNSFIYFNFYYYRLSNYNANTIKKVLGREKIEKRFDLARRRQKCVCITKT